MPALVKGCYDKFEKFENMKGPGGVVDVVATTPEQCQQNCLANAACYGFDFLKIAASPLCLTYNKDFVNELTPYTQYDAYVRVRCIKPGSYVPTPGKPTLGLTAGDG